ncbi:hypothetical protein [Amycolatopsis sp. CA-230715]|uniref:hypothetical protein n=1 Tax=Amycolatopsis sp. CA-230715 TaxID=2745196 RepID=UPI001C01CEE2|nr:hypothetical protein [Amycolatopsis sp. CA-230715]
MIVVLVLGTGVAVWALLPGDPTSRQADPDPDRIPLTAAWPTPGGKTVKPLPMPTGEMVVALPISVRNDVFCGAVDDGRLTALIGGPVLREVKHIGEHPLSCHIAAPGRDIEISAETAADLIPDRRVTVQVSGREGLLHRSLGSTELKVPFLAPRSPAAQRKDSEIAPILRVYQRSGSDEDAIALASAVLETTTKPGPLLPAVGSHGTIPPERTEPTPGFGVVGSALPQLARQLCTILADEAHLDLATAEAKMNGSCSIRNGESEVSADFSEIFDGSTVFDETINGTSVSITPYRMIVRLEGKPYQGITVSVGYPPPPGLDYKAFTERVVAKLAGKG